MTVPTVFSALLLLVCSAASDSFDFAGKSEFPVRTERFSPASPLSAVNKKKGGRSYALRPSTTHPKTTKIKIGDRCTAHKMASRYLVRCDENPRAPAQVRQAIARLSRHSRKPIDNRLFSGGRY